MANRILLADDSITIQKVVNLTFVDEGIEVVAVSNGDQAERRLADVQPDLVLADIFMPGKNGYELCEAIKESAQYHHIPVVLLVGAFEPFDQAEARRVKADAHLTKPFESRTLVETVRRLISSSSQPRTGPLPALPVPDAKTAPAAPSAVAAPTSMPPPVEPRAAVQMTQPFNLDLAAMANSNPPPAPPAVMAAPLSLDFNYGSNEDPLAVPIEVQVADAPAAESAFAASSNLNRRTDDLSFGDNQPPFEALGLEELFAEPLTSEAPPAPLASADAPAGFGEVGQDAGFAVPSTFGYATEEVLLDFDQATPATRRAAQEPFSFDIDEREAASVDASGMQMEPAGVELADKPEVLKTTMLAPPAPTASVDGAINTNPLEMPAAPAASETPSAFEAPLDQSALFNVDDPLGDVLDEGPVEAMATEAPVATIAPLEATAESLVIDAPPEPSAVASVAASAVEEFANDAPPQADASAATWESPVDYEVEFPVEPMTANAAPDPVVAESAFEMHVQPFEPATTSETGFGFTTVAEEAEDIEPAPRTTEAKFTASSMWTNEEARFAAIDIEATPVEDMAEAAASEEMAEPAESPVFEEDASAYITQANLPVELAAPVEAVESLPTPIAEPAAEPVAEESAAIAPPSPEAQAPAVSSAVELSPALVDEIVRRVVAQISESVVREIAWEVVPDCVERVIKEMTAQEVSKH